MTMMDMLALAAFLCACTGVYFMLSVVRAIKNDETESKRFDEWVKREYEAGQRALEDKREIARLKRELEDSKKGYEYE